MRLFQKSIWPPDYQNPPWGSAPSIYEHIKAHVDPDRQTGLSEEGYRLPDEPEPDANKVSFAPGALDGMFGHHGSNKPEGELVSELYGALEQATKSASESNIGKLYSLMNTEDAINLIDALIDRIQLEKALDASRVREIVYWFTTKAAHREPVKFSMALLGLLRGDDDSEVFLTLGRHDEFTLYSAVAISSNEDYGESVLWQLAKTAEGWGRINTVERLADTDDPSIKDWLIRDGYKNDVMYEYLACICARAGDLHIALQAEQVDDELFKSACEIVETLIHGEGGPAGGLQDYEHGCAVVRLLMEHGADRFSSASDFQLLVALKNRIDVHLSGERALGQDWTEPASSQVAAQIGEVLGDDKWRAVISDALETGNRDEFWAASRVSNTLNIDAWPYFFNRTEAGEDYWWDLMRSPDEDRIDKVLELGIKRIPLAEIATGPGNEMGLGAEYKHHSALGFILQDLKRFPGKGWEFVSTGLQSSVVRNRNVAIRVLSDWGRNEWPDEAEAALKALKKIEPDDGVKGRIENALAGRPLD